MLKNNLVQVLGLFIIITLLCSVSTNLVGNTMAQGPFSLPPQSGDKSQVISRFDNRNPFCDVPLVRQQEPEVCDLPCPKGWTKSGDFCELRVFLGRCPQGQMMWSSSGSVFLMTVLVENVMQMGVVSSHVQLAYQI